MPGAVYTYETVDGGATWSYTEKIVAADGASNDEFGFSVSLNGDMLVVGARFKDTTAIKAGSGKVHVIH